jgi:transcriptional regulator
MYDLPHFKAVNNAEVLAFMKAHPFIILCGISAAGQPVASHIPVLIEERDGHLYLLGHTMKKQDHTSAFQNNPSVLAIFSGAHSYVSASWYTDPKTASTWNYQAVHAHGSLHFLDDDGLFDFLSRLTRHFEGREDSPSLVHQLDETYVRNMMKAITAFEIEVTEIKHVFKMSQNRNEAGYDNIINHLQKGSAEDMRVAEIMSKRKEKVFPNGDAEPI